MDSGKVPHVGELCSVSVLVLFFVWYCSEGPNSGIGAGKGLRSDFPCPCEAKWGLGGQRPSSTVSGSCTTDRGIQISEPVLLALPGAASEPRVDPASYWAHGK